MVLVRDCQLLATTCTTGSQYAAAVLCCHSLAETMLVRTTTVVWLECSFHFLIVVLIIIIFLRAYGGAPARNHHSVWAAKLLIFFKSAKNCTVFRAPSVVFSLPAEGGACRYAGRSRQINTSFAQIRQHSYCTKPTLRRPRQACTATVVRASPRPPHTRATAAVHPPRVQKGAGNLPQKRLPSRLSAPRICSQSPGLQNIWDNLACFQQKCSNFAGAGI